MKGLLIKDVKLMLGQKKFFVVVVGLGIFFMLSNANPVSGVSYITMLLSIFTLSTISYDEFDNGMAFLMTLPIERKTYALEKYVFAGLVSLISAVGTSVLAYILGMVMDVPVDMAEVIGVACVIVLVSWLILSVTIPLQIKFGSEKGRIAMILAMGAIFGILFVVAKGLSSSGADMSGVVLFLDSLEAWQLVSASVFVTILVLLASYAACVRIINKKEY
ncbi:MAG: ABC-2 transporter permease [Lachnospiraceae bacterium]|nr:ABC-2 transporter permease [Lachnospiraceae bacterium]